MKKVLFIFLCLMPINIYGYEVNVHMKITENAVLVSTVKEYLQKNLNISVEKDSFEGKLVSTWLSSGSDWEDNTIITYFPARYLNHFYDPTTDKGILVFPSSLTWAKSHGLNAWSWKKAREYFKSALTGETADVRNKAYADTFRAVGQIAHLLQDTASPAHVRNDSHGFGEPYETYTYDAQEKRNGALPLTYTGYAPVSITPNNFSYIDLFWKTGAGKGLAEFTNSNFFSSSKNYDSHAYEKPAISGEITETVQVSDAGTGEMVDVEVSYLTGTVTDAYRGSQYENVPLTAYSLFDYHMQKLNGERVFSLNDLIHRRYADLLVPRAVGYSAGLLNYFFRGEIDMVPDASAGSGYVIQNKSAEDMNGAFTLYYDGTDGKRISLKTWSLSVKTGASSENLTFTKPTDAQTPGVYLLVFNGTMGQESGAVTGRMLKLGERVITGRLVRATSYWNWSLGKYRNTIKVFTESGVLTKELLADRSITQVRFNVKNHDEFVLESEGYTNSDCAGGQAYKNYNKFIIDEKNKAAASY